MKFEICRTAQRGREKPPLESENFNVKFSSDGGYGKWTVEIETIERLVELIKEVNVEVVLGIYGKKDSMPEIEIYDDYRE